MTSQQQTLDIIIHVLDDMKAQNIIKLDVRNQTSITDFMFICTGRSSRHVSAISDELYNQLKKSGHDYLRTSGTEHGEWALIDCGDVLIHVMQPETRAFYNLEELWSNIASE